ncbi:MAG: histidine kinase, partial [Gemmatimonadetes bacterium]|nr:histidine kinase [Gemmatimonadota bacterium]NIT68363.1 histidine kinase [Gemmatimonadota bacterium]NIW76917.1 histidine kinase [Gemmatimonadota bacterium]NIY36940.1 histidine kinase [Gemmatimonadota bacterium]
LGDGELDDEALATPDSGAMGAVVEALCRELNDIKVAIRDAGRDPAQLADVLPQFRRVSDTMAILGLGATLKIIQEPHSQLARLLATQDQVSSGDIEAIIEQLERAEAELNPDAFASQDSEQMLFNDSEEAQEQLDGAFGSVVRESRVGLEQAKEAIIEFVATQWNHACLTDVPGKLREIRGSLNMIPLSRASAVLAACERYVADDLLASERVPEWQMLDTLADAITSIDYYLERLSDDV